jgi:hypothetical protein
MTSDTEPQDFGQRFYHTSEIELLDYLGFPFLTRVPALELRDEGHEQNFLEFSLPKGSNTMLIPLLSLRLCLPLPLPLLSLSLLCHWIYPLLIRPSPSPSPSPSPLPLTLNYCGMKGKNRIFQASVTSRIHHTP